MTIVQKKYSGSEFHVTYSVDQDSDGIRLDQFLQHYLTSLSRQQIKKKIDKGEISIRGRDSKHRPSSKVHFGEFVDLVQKDSGQEIEIWDGAEVELERTPEVIFEDDSLIVISKPPFMVTHPTGRHIFYCATVCFETKYDKTIHSIHRLDRETSGLLMLGKNPAIAAEITTLFEKRKISKCYFFIAHKRSEVPIQFTANERLHSEPVGPRKVIVEPFPFESSNGKHASTKFQLLWQNSSYVIGLAFPKTGRQHQIRVHALAHGLPLVGDKLYHGGYKVFQRFKDIVATKEDHSLMEIPRHALHAVALKLHYKGEDRLFHAPLPEDLSSFIKMKKIIKIDELEKLIIKELSQLV